MPQTILPPKRVSTPNQNSNLDLPVTSNPVQHESDAIDHATIDNDNGSEKVFRAEVATGGKAVASEVNRRRLIHRAKMKSFRISVVIVVTFIVWWTPYYTMMVIFMFLNPDKHKSEDLQSAIFFFGMSNSLVNPLIYGAFHLWKPKAARKGSTMYCYSREGSVVHQRSMMTNMSNASSRSGSSKMLLARPSVESHLAMPVHEEEKLLVQPLHKATTGS
uniref:G-protein coupled receptors family 1 profile domain-containing protein n=1 Tax=Timema douglasi TaxID=61478 RepID=A0A7R8Z717_TIMDO|nr:unnamed protein product [Timema douglasi]